MCSLTLYVLSEGLSGAQRRELVNASLYPSVSLSVYLSFSPSLFLYLSSMLPVFLIICLSAMSWFVGTVSRGFCSCLTVVLSACLTCLSDLTLSAWRGTVCLTGLPDVVLSVWPVCLTWYCVWPVCLTWYCVWPVCLT